MIPLLLLICNAIIRGQGNELFINKIGILIGELTGEFNGSQECQQ